MLPFRPQQPSLPVRALPARAGIGLKGEHARALLEQTPVLGFLEVHAENYMGAGGPAHAALTHLRERYAISVHGVGLSIGGLDPLDVQHLDRLRILIDRYQPESFSEHLAWSSHGGTYLNDLLPIAYDTPALLRVVSHLQQAQECLGRRILLENPSTYVAYASSTWDEVEFMAEVAQRSGCGLLLDVNNVQVSCANHGRDPLAYIDAFPMAFVAELHLAGYAEEVDSLGARLLIDAHDRPVAPDVWALYRHVIARIGAAPTLIEWDNDVPPLDILLAEARKADAVMDQVIHNAEAAQ